MNLDRIYDAALRFMDEPGGNYVAEGAAIRPDLAGLRMYDFPVLGVASPDDGYFETCREPGVIGPHFMPPRAWLPEARSVISLFLAFTPKVADTNAALPTWPSDEWLHARIEGQAFLNALMSHLKNFLEEGGYPSVVPSDDPRFCSAAARKAGTSANTEKLPGLSFTSVWSERHVAYACGLGTFGLSKGFITKHGIAGRFGSIVTTLELPPTGRDYTGAYQYCTMCGACAINCPVGAISLEGGKDHQICSDFLDKTKERYRPRYGCGKCQVAVPCQGMAPGV